LPELKKSGEERISRSGFVQGYTAELAVSAIISSWHCGTSGWFPIAEKITAETLLGN